MCHCMIQFIKNDHKIQDMRAEMFILISFHIVNQYHTKTDGFFFPPKSNVITNVILILYSSSLKKNLILTHLRFRHNMECFCSISPTNIISTRVSEQQLFCS